MGWKFSKRYNDYIQDKLHPEGGDLSIVVEGDSISDLITFTDGDTQAITMDIDILERIVDDLKAAGALL